MQILVLIGTVGASSQTGKILPFCDFLDRFTLYDSNTPEKLAQIDIKVAISQKLLIRSRPNLTNTLRPTIALRGWYNITSIKSDMAAGRHLEKWISRHNSADDSSILTKLCWSMQNGMLMTISLKFGMHIDFHLLK